MKKFNWKKHLQARLKITGFILALVGWFLMITVTLEKIFKKDLSTLENIMETNMVKWGINFFAIIFLIILIKGQSGINNILEKHKTLRIILKIIFIGGLIGWIVGLGSLLI
ncbi:MAG: hypothetical protein ABIJ28_03300 [Patescibacteria group bacterium]